MSFYDRTVTFKKIAYKGKYHDDQALYDVIKYITNPEKTPSNIIYGVGVDMDRIAESMMKISEEKKKNSRLRLHHFVLAFKPEYQTEKKLLGKIAKNICNVIGRQYQIISALHEDTESPNIHFVFNAVSYIDGYKYRGGKKEYFQLQKDIKRILYKHELGPLISVKYKPTSMDKYE